MIFELDFIYEEVRRINDFLQGMFRGVGIKLVDFKVEFGRSEIDGKREVMLADEISPDTCRLWDMRTDKKLDKDRFRNDLGNLVEAYQEVAIRLNLLHEQSNIRPLNYPKPKAVKIKKNESKSNSYFKMECLILKVKQYSKPLMECLLIMYQKWDRENILILKLMKARRVKPNLKSKKCVKSF